jgi:hypothetical protein
MSHLAVLLLSLLAFGAFAMPRDSIPVKEKAPNAALATPAEANELLSKAREANGDLYRALKSFVCREEIERFKEDMKKSKTRPIDHVSTNLSFENGVEHYNDVRQNERSVPSLPDIMGAWSEGEFGTLLQQTGKLLEIQPVNFVSFETVNGIQTAVYRFVVPEKDSPWDLSVGTQHYKIPFTTDVWISVASGEILKIARKSIAISPETRIGEIDWDVSLGAVDLSGRTWLLPTLARYSVSYSESKRREFNQMSFSNYKHYGSESSLKFDFKEK